MGLEKVAFNFLVKNGKDEVVRSLLCHTQQIKPSSLKSIKYLLLSASYNKVYGLSFFLLLFGKAFILSPFNYFSVERRWSPNSTYFDKQKTGGETYF